MAFSGGKDSTVLLNLCYDYAKENDLLDHLAMYHLDYEAQYQATTDFVTETFAGFPGIRKFWLCLPVGANCGCRMDADTWIPWERAKMDLWVRQMPDSPYLINQDNCPFEMYEGERDYDVQDHFSEWFSHTYGEAGIMIGIRADESLNRYRAISSERKVHGYKDKPYIVSKDEITHSCYPIYDWTVSDIWTYNARYLKKYNRLYDLYYQAGLSVDQMRVANPFHSCGEDALKLYKVIDPQSWGKMVGRVNGVNFAGLYGGTTAMGWKKITKPKNFTWKQYCYFLLGTLPPKLREHYEEKLNTSLKFWREKGGALSKETIKELDAEGDEYTNRGQIRPHTNKDVISFDDYLDDTQSKDFKSLPTWKRMCVCIIKNDYSCKYMGFAQNKEERDRRAAVIEKYKNI